MEMKAPTISFREQTSRPMRAVAGDLRLTSRVLKITLGPNGGLIWNFPVCVYYQPDGESEQCVPVVDRTRLAQIGLLFLGMVGALVLGQLFASKSK